MRYRAFRILEMAERDPASEESCILDRIDRQRSRRARDVVGILVSGCAEILVDGPAPMQPPDIGIHEKGSVIRCKTQEACNFVLLALAAGELHALKEQTPIGGGWFLGIRGQARHELCGIACAGIDGNAGLCLLALHIVKLWQQATCGCNPRCAPRSKTALVDQERIEPAAMVGLRQKTLEAREETHLGRHWDVMLAPSLDGHVLGARFIAERKMRRGKRDRASTGQRWIGPEERDDFLRGTAGGEKLLLRAAPQQGSVRPCRVLGQELRVIRWRARALAKRVPRNECSQSGIAEFARVLVRRGGIVSIDRAERILEHQCIGLWQPVITERRDELVHGGEVVRLGRIGDGRTDGGRSARRRDRSAVLVDDAWLCFRSPLRARAR